MNKKIFSILIISATSHWEQLLKAALPNDNLAAISTLPSPPANHEILLSADIIIDNISQQLNELKRFTSLKSKYILLTAASDLISSIIEDSQLSLPLTDVWSTTDNEKLLQLRFRQLIERLSTENKLITTNNLLNTTINILPDLIWFKRTDGIHVMVNDAFAETVEKEKTDIEGYDHFHIWDITRDEYEKSDYVCVDTDSIVLANRKGGVFDEKVATKKGLRRFRTYKSPLWDEKNNIIGTVGIAQDVTEIENMSKLIDITFNNLPFAMLVKDLNGNILRVNTKFSDDFHSFPQELVGTKLTLRDILNKKNISHTLDETKHELQLITPTSISTFKIGIYPIKDSFNQLIAHLYLYRDITAELLFENRLKKYAYTDTLTSLYTRRYLYEYIEQFDKHQLCTLLLIDIDDFKKINDTYGHNCGDEILSGLAHIMHVNFTEGIPVRLGGDEFLILFPHETNHNDLIVQLDIFFHKLTEFSTDQITHRGISVSIGISSGYCSNIDELNKCIEKCDSALYTVKTTGKNSYNFYNE